MIQNTYKAGDRVVAIRDSGDIKKGEVVTVANPAAPTAWPWVHIVGKDGSFMELNFKIAEPKFKAGDIVECIDNAGCPGEFTVGKKYAVIDVDSEGLVSAIGDNGKQDGMFAYRFKLAAPFKIEAGKRYVDENGDVVGPMRIWRAGVRHKFDDGHPNGKLYRDDGGSDYAPRLISEAPAPKPANSAIVAKLIGDMPKPAPNPFVHADVEAAKVEAERLAGIHPGEPFAVYERVSTHKVEKVYDHEWQRLAVDGQKIGAIKELRSITGLGLAETKRAVEGWLERELG